MTDKQKESLLYVARKVVEAAVRREPVSNFDTDDPLFNEKRGCFVTLHNHGQLRGCIGQFQPDQPLLKTIEEMSVATTRDSRFAANPVAPGELGEIDIEISVLSPLEPTDDPLSLELGKHGIYIKHGYSSGCFLPQDRSKVMLSGGQTAVKPDVLPGFSVWVRVMQAVVMNTAHQYAAWSQQNRLSLPWTMHLNWRRPFSTWIYVPMARILTSTMSVP